MNIPQNFKRQLYIRTALLLVVFSFVVLAAPHASSGSAVQPAQSFKTTQAPSYSASSTTLQSETEAAMPDKTAPSTSPSALVVSPAPTYAEPKATTLTPSSSTSAAPTPDPSSTAANPVDSSSPSTSCINNACSISTPKPAPTPPVHACGTCGGTVPPGTRSTDIMCPMYCLQ